MFAGTCEAQAGIKQCYVITVYKHRLISLKQKYETTNIINNNVGANLKKIKNSHIQP